MIWTGVVNYLAVVNFLLSLALIYVFGRLVLMRRGWLRAVFILGTLLNLYVAATYAHLFVTGFMLASEYIRIAFTLTLALLLSAAINELYTPR